jgi:hypothetical protein
MVASPAGLPALDVGREKGLIERSLQPVTATESGRDARLELHWVEGQTYDDLKSWLLDRGPWHVLHFIGHGGFDEERGQGVVVLAGGNGQPEYLVAPKLAELLAAQDALRLVVLNACEGAQGSSHDRFSSLAATLIARGKPAVVAMQYRISDEAAISFASTFYTALATFTPVDLAVAVARKRLSLDSAASYEWATPVAYLRSEDSVVFEPFPTLWETLYGWMINQPLVRDRWRASAFVLGAAWMVGLGVGLYRGLTAPLACRSAGLFFNLHFSWAMAIGAATMLGLLVAEALRGGPSSETRAAGVPAVWRSRDQGRPLRLARLAMLLGTIGFTLAHASIGMLNGSRGALIVPFSLALGFVLSAALCLPRVFDFRFNRPRLLAGAAVSMTGFALTYAAVAIYAVHVANPRYLGDIGILWNARSYDAGGCTANGTLAFWLGGLPHWAQLVAGIDAALLGLAMFIGISLGTLAVAAVLQRWNAMAERSRP